MSLPAATYVVLDAVNFGRPMQIHPNDGTVPCPAGVLFYAVEGEPTFFGTLAEAEAAIARSIAWRRETRGKVEDREAYRVVESEVYELEQDAKRIRAAKVKKARSERLPPADRVTREEIFG